MGFAYAGMVVPILLRRHSARLRALAVHIGGATIVYAPWIADRNPIRNVSKCSEYHFAYSKCTLPVKVSTPVVGEVKTTEKSPCPRRVAKAPVPSNTSQ